MHNKTRITGEISLENTQHWIIAQKYTKGNLPVAFKLNHLFYVDGSIRRQNFLSINLDKSFMMQTNYQLIHLY